MANFCHFQFKYISHQQLTVALLYICLQILCAVLIVNVLTITEGRPRHQTDAVEHVPHLTARNISGSQSSANVLTRSKRQTTKPLRDYCLGWSTSQSYNDACVEAIFICYGYRETVCRNAHASCGRVIPQCGYPSCKSGDENLITIEIDGQETEVQQTLNCRCSC